MSHHTPPLRRTALPRRPSFLFLRRHPGQRIVVFDGTVEAWIELLRVDLPEKQAVLTVTGLDEPVILPLRAGVPFLQGDGIIRLQALEAYGKDAYASLGIRVPREVLIRREELVKGTTREIRAEIARTAQTMQVA